MAKAKKVQEYSLNLGLNYAAKWGVDRAVREIGTNAIDANRDDYFVRVNDNTLIVHNGLAYDDEGNPVYLSREHWVMGVSEKFQDGAVGKFGEGLKVGCVVLLRLGYTDIQIRSGHYIYTPFVKTVTTKDKNKRKQGSQQIVWVRQEESDSVFEGTQVTVRNFVEDVKVSDVFLYPDDLRIIYDQNDNTKLLQEDVPNLWSGHVRICEMESIFDREWAFGYCFHPEQIELERDRTRPSSHNVRWAATQLWKGVDSETLWYELWQAVGQNKGESLLYWDYMNPYDHDMAKIMRTAFYRAFGEFAVVSTSHEFSNALRNTKFNPIEFTSKVLRKFLLDDLKILSDVEATAEMDAEYLQSLDINFDASLNIDESINKRMLQRRTNVLAELLEQPTFTWEVKGFSAEDMTDDGESETDWLVNRELSIISQAALADRKEAFSIWVRHAIKNFWDVEHDNYRYSNYVEKILLMVLTKEFI